jgi:phage tail sheath protein FI
VLAGSDATLYNTIVVRSVPTGAPVVTDSMIVERWIDVSLDPTSPRYMLTLINNSTNGSLYITPSLHAGYAFTALDVLAASVTAGGDPLTAGADGATPTLGSTGQLWGAVPNLDVVSDPFDLYLPGVTDAATINEVITYCDPALGGRGDVFLIVDPQVGRTAAQLITDEAAFTDTSYAAMYAPQQLVSDPSSSVPGSTRMQSPGGLVAGQFAETDNLRGVFKAAAGTGNQLAVLDVETRFKNAELDSLNAAGVNVIKPVPGNGICIYGARTFKPSPADKYIPIRRSLIYLENQLKVVTQFAVFEPNDQILWGHLTSVCERVLRDFWTAGGLKGTSPAQAYYVVCSDENNTEATISAGEVHIECGVALQYPVEFVIINIGQFDGGTTITDTAA